MTRVTITVLAARLGISKASVSYALNGQPGVSEATRQRVLGLAAELGWRPSSIARSLSRSKADAIGMVLKRDAGLLGSEPYYMGLLAGVEDVLSHAEQSLLLRMVGTENGRDLEVYRTWSAEHRVDGVIVLDLAINDPRPALLTDLGLPFVLHGLHKDPHTETTVIDDQTGDAAKIVEHLSALGHRHIAHLTGPLFLAHEADRRDSIAAEAARRRMRATFLECDYTMATAEQTAYRMLAADDTPTAIVASNDVMALGISTALRDSRREDIALISWDDSMICQIATPAVSALARHPDEQGRRSARLLLNVLSGVTGTQQGAIRSDLIVRETSRPARAAQRVR